MCVIIACVTVLYAQQNYLLIKDCNRPFKRTSTKPIVCMQSFTYTVMFAVLQVYVFISSRDYER